MTPEEIKTLFARRYQASARHDAVALAADFAEDCVLESPVAGTQRGRAAVEKVYRLFFAAFPDIVIQYDEVFGGGDRAALTLTVQGTDTGGFLGQAPTGKRFRFSCVFLYSFRDRQIVVERRVYDLHGIMLQLATGEEPLAPGSEVYRATLDRARMAQELRIAAEIQRALLPELRRKGPNFDVSAASIPCRAIGGDFIDYFDLPNDRFGFALGDVTGKGPPAALLAAEVQGVLAAHSDSGGMPSETVARVNRVLVRRPVECRFATLLYGQLSCGGQLAYCNAGHNPPFLIGRRGVRRLDRGGLILGMFADATFEEESIQLDSGDTLVVFSDGVTEAFSTNGTEFGDERLQACVETYYQLPTTALLDCLIRAVREFSVGAEQSDDLTALVLRYEGP